MHWTRMSFLLYAGKDPLGDPQCLEGPDWAPRALIPGVLFLGIAQEPFPSPEEQPVFPCLGQGRWKPRGVSGEGHPWGWETPAAVPISLQARAADAGPGQGDAPGASRPQTGQAGPAQVCGAGPGDLNPGSRPGLLCSFSARCGGSGRTGLLRRGQAKSIPKCLLALVDSRNVFHGSCLGMAVAVGSCGRSTWRPGKYLNNRCQKELELLHNEICKNPTSNPLDCHQSNFHGLVTMARSVQSCWKCTGPGCHFHFMLHRSHSLAQRSSKCLKSPGWTTEKITGIWKSPTLGVCGALDYILDLKC
ncbi:uncharacterized protein GJ701_005958 isoform 2-T2 [Geothlypis trichas]